MAVKERGRARLVLACVGPAPLWVLVQRGMLTSSLPELPGVPSSLCSLASICCVVLAALCAGLFRTRTERLLDSPCALVAVGLACCAASGLCCLFGGHAATQGLVLFGLVMLCAVEAVTFCLAFLGWAHWLCAFARSCGLPHAVLVQLGAIALSFFVAPLGVSDTGYLAFVRAASSPLSAFCLAALVRLDFARQDDPACAPSLAARAARETHAVPWLVATGVGFLLVGLIGYAPHLGEEASTSYSEGVLSFGFALLCLVPLAALCARPRVLGGNGRRVALACVLVATLAVMACFFGLALVILTGSSLQFEIARFMRRVSRIAFYLLLLVCTCQLSLPVARTFAWAFLVPAFVPKLVLSLSDFLGLDALGSVEGMWLGAGMTGAGFLFTACIVIALFLSIDGGLTGTLIPGIFGEENAGGGGDADDRVRKVSGDRGQACAGIARVYGLSEREREVMLLLSCGHSLQKVCEELSVSRGTVNTHSRFLYAKLGVHSKQEVIDLVDAAVQAGGPTL